MLVLETILLILYFFAQTIEIAAGAVSLVAKYDVPLFAVFTLALGTITFFAIKKWPMLKNNNRTALVIGHLLLYGAIFVSYNKFETHYADMGTSIYGTTFSMTFMNTAIVFAIAIVSAFCIPPMLKAPFMKKYFSKKYLISLGVVSAYSAFAVFGDSLFFQYDFSLITLMVYLLGVLWVFPMIMQILALYEWILLRLQRSDTKKTYSKRFVWLTTFIIFVSIWLVYLVAFNPAQMSPDSLTMWYHATSGEKIGNLGSPTLVVLFVRWLSYIIPHPMFIVIVQILCFSTLCSFFMVEFHQRKFSLHTIYIFTFVFAALPPNGLMITTLWSNIPYTLSMLYMSYGIFKLFYSNRGRIIPYINIALALPLVNLTRYEGFITAIICAVLFLCLSFKKLINIKLLAATVTGCILILLIQVPLYKAVQIEHEDTPMGSGILLDGLHSVVYYNGNLSDDTRDFMASIMPLEVWQSEYYDYDILGMASKDFTRIYIDSVGSRFAQEGYSSTLFSHYLSTLTREPFLLIKNRLAKSNLVWGIAQPKGSYNERCMTWTASGEVGFPHRDNILGTIISKWVYPVTIAFAPMDVLLYRSGVYIILSLILCIVLISRKSLRLGMPLIPMAGGVAALLLAMCWPCFRVVWFIPVIFVLTFPLILSRIARFDSKDA